MLRFSGDGRQGDSGRLGKACANDHERRRCAERVREQTRERRSRGVMPMITMRFAEADRHRRASAPGARRPWWGDAGHSGEGATRRVMKRDTVAGGGGRSIMGGSEAAKQRARCRDEGVWPCEFVGEVANPTAGLLNRAATAATLMRRSTGGQVMRDAQRLCSDGERGVYGS